MKQEEYNRKVAPLRNNVLFVISTHNESNDDKINPNNWKNLEHEVVYIIRKECLSWIVYCKKSKWNNVNK